jgi:hypothetical protein
MNMEKYSVVSDNNHIAYEFLSQGPRGTIKKVVFYQEIEENIFNLAFGDWDEKKQKIDDRIRSNNSDRDKVLATVAFTVMDFIKYHPESLIFVQGSTPARTRLYQIGILQTWAEISQLFDLRGFLGDRWEPFRKGENYDGFILKAK